MGKKPVSKEKRVSIAALYKTNMFTQAEIARQCKISPKCVHTTLRNLKENGSPQQKKPLGPKQISTEREDRQLFKLARDNPKRSARWLSQNWLRDGKPIAKRVTVNRRLLSFNLRSYMATSKPLLTQRHVDNRLAWCIARKDWTYAKWANVIFSDESNYQLINRKTTPKVRRLPDEKYDPKFVKKKVQGGGGSIGIWGCIGELGAGFCATYTGTLNASRYESILEKGLIPSKDRIAPESGKWIFQQDGARCHTAKRIKNWFDQKGFTTIPWPANSPDLNPIEHLWAEIDKKLDNNPPKTLAELEVALTKLWNDIKRDDCVSVIESMPERVRLCIKAKGGYFKY